MVSPPVWTQLMVAWGLEPSCGECGAQVLP
jgi:hypothetical protein